MRNEERDMVVRTKPTVRLRVADFGLRIEEAGTDDVVREAVRTNKANGGLEALECGIRIVECGMGSEEHEAVVQTKPTDGRVDRRKSLLKKG